KRNALQPGELIVAARVPVQRGPQDYLKVGVRNAMVIAVASLAMAVDLDARTIGVGLGSVGPTPLAADDATTWLAGRVEWGAHGTEIVTVEGLQPDDRGALSDVQRAFVQEGAVQCGFCTPGLVMAVHDLLARDETPTDLAVREAISGNLCRCTGYGRVFEAVRAAVNERLEARACASRRRSGLPDVLLGVASV